MAQQISQIWNPHPDDLTTGGSRKTVYRNCKTEQTRPERPFPSAETAPGTALFTSARSSPGPFPSPFPLSAHSPRSSSSVYESASGEKQVGGVKATRNKGIFKLTQ